MEGKGNGKGGYKSRDRMVLGELMVVEVRCWYVRVGR